MQGATLDRFMASDAAEASAEAERHLIAVRQQAAEAEHAVISLEAAIAETKASMPAPANADRPR